MVLLRRSRLEGLNEDFSGLFALLLALRGRQGPGGSAHGPHHDGSVPPAPAWLSPPSCLCFPREMDGSGTFFIFFISIFCRGGAYLAGCIQLQLV